MAQVVEPELSQTSFLCHPLKRLDNQIRVRRRPIGMAKPIIAIPCLTAAVVSVASNDSIDSCGKSTDRPRPL